MSNTASLKKEYAERIAPALKNQFQYSSSMQIPVLKKIVINQGLGMAVADKKIIEVAINELTAITGQKAVATVSRKDIANFKLRKKMPIGVMVTLRRERMYEFLEKLVEDSYDDHSRFLAERSRYERLFKLNIKDYKGWAKGLQKCGYATDRAYANKLIKVIEDYELYRFDSGKGTKKTSTKKQNLPVFNYQVYRTHGLIYVYAKDNDSFDQIARSMGFKAKQLMKFNEVPEDFPLQEGDIVYLEKKKKKADKPNYDHVVQVGESMHSIAQMYGIQIKSLYKMNKKDKDYIPEEGDVLKLR